ncbi:ROK family protein [Enterococcus sp. BWR-S5]|uniref:ROK family protein n=1 Tax=Enterococcus sp. BWR-S5 TaxID=2787714 RepID=UPI001F34B65E|nr:ROK family protein [Enterococcus sp. BWR-S5]
MQTVLAVDLGGTKILVGEVTRDGHILSTQKYPSNVDSMHAAAEKIKEAIRDFLSQQEVQGQLIGIGVCVVGRVETATGNWFEIRPGLSEPINLSHMLSKEFQLPCWVTNDVSGAALAEKVLGKGKETDNFVYINIGTGIAGRVVTDGQLIVGGNCNAGEVGHMVVDMNSEDRCLCGRQGCVELFASGLGMHNQVMKFAADYPDSLIDIKESERVPFYALIRAYEENDPLAKKVVSQALKAAAALVMNLVRVSDPEAVVFGGGVMNDGWFLDHLVTFLNEKTIRFVTKSFSVTELDPNAVALKGAAALVFIKQKGEQSYAGV